jgi:uncharacterized protein (DUF58 family)
LSSVYDTPRRTTGPGHAADLAAALAQLERTHIRRGQIVVTSDFLDRSDWATPLRRLTMRHQVIAVQVSDPREFRLPPVGILSVIDTESGQHLDVQTNSADLRERYAAAANRRQDGIRQAIVKAGAAHLHLSTDRDWLVDVVRFVGRRRVERVPSSAALHRQGFKK